MVFATDKALTKAKYLEAHVWLNKKLFLLFRILCDFRLPRVYVYKRRRHKNATPLKANGSVEKGGCVAYQWTPAKCKNDSESTAHFFRRS